MKITSLQISASLTSLLKQLGYISVLAFLPAANAQVVWNGAGDGTTWGDDANWIGGSAPTGSDLVQLQGATVTVDTIESYTGFDATGDDGTLIIENGGELTANASGNAFRRIAGVTINSGGKLISADTNNIRSGFITINSGGELRGTDSILDQDLLTVDGIFRPMDTIDGNNQFDIGSLTTRGTVVLNPGGTIELDLFGNGVNEGFRLFPDNNPGLKSELDIANGSIDLVLQGGYSPTIGDSFDLWDDPNGDSILTLGDGSNITLSGYSLNTSSFATDGVVTVVPEPTSLLLSALGFLLVGFGIKFRR